MAAACDRRDSVARESADSQRPAALALVQGLDDEGGLIAPTRLSDSVLVAFFRHDSAFADARLIADYLRPGVRVGVIAGRLTLDGVDTQLPVETHNGVTFAPVQAFADRFRAYARIRETPDRMVTLWRSDVLCRYARGADRRASVFIEAAEKELLQYCQPPIRVAVRRWAAAAADERWAASVTLRQPVDSASGASLLERYGARPYVVYGGVAGHHLIVRASPDSPSLAVFGKLRVAAIDALRHAVCGFPGALERRGLGAPGRTRSGDVDVFHGERHMLVSVQAARRELPRVRVGAPIIHGFDVVATAGDLRRLSLDSHTLRFDPATRVDTSWVLPGTDMSVVAGVATPRDVARLDSAALFAALESEAARARAECRDI